MADSAALFYLAALVLMVGAVIVGGLLLWIIDRLRARDGRLLLIDCTCRDGRPCRDYRHHPWRIADFRQAHR